MSKINKFFIYLLIFILLYYCDVFILMKFSPDYQNYISYLNFNDYDFFRKEISFIFIVFFVKQISIIYAPYLLYSIYFFIVFYLLILILKKCELKYKELILIMYIFYFYFIYTIVQIRMGIAVLIFLIGIRYLANGNKIKYIFCIVLATLFHYMASIFIFFLFLNNRKFSYIYFLLPFLGMFLYFVHISTSLSFLLYSFNHYLPSYFYIKLQFYLNNFYQNNVHIINIISLIKLILFLIFSYIIIRIKHNSKMIYDIKFKLYLISFKIYSISLFIYFLFANILPVVSNRVGEQLSVVILYLLPLSIYYIKEKRLKQLLLILYILLGIIVMLKMYYELFIILGHAN